MTNYQKAIELATTLKEQADAYENRPTKAESKRMRATLGELKKIVTPAKQDLLAADKG